MATAGSIVVDLLMRTGSFETDSKRAEARLRGVERTVNQVTAAVASASAAAAISITAWAAKTSAAAQEIDRLTRLSGSSAEAFQQWAYGAQTAGIEQGKLADILKDTRDRIGDFLTTGGGPMADFFETIAPKIGVTAEQFRNLSGQEALGLFVRSLEKANISQNEMVFFMEAMASDSALLLPLLRDNAAGMQEMGDEAERLGLIMSTETIAASVSLQREIDRATGVLRGMSVTLFGSAIPLISDVSTRMSEFATNTRDMDDAARVLDSTLRMLLVAGVGIAGAFDMAAEVIATAASAAVLAAQGDFKLALNALELGGDNLVSKFESYLGRIRWLLAEAGNGVSNLPPVTVPGVRGGAGGNTPPPKPAGTDPLASFRARLAEQQELTAALQAYGLAVDDMLPAERELLKLQSQLGLAVKDRVGRTSDATLRSQIAITQETVAQERLAKAMRLTLEMRRDYIDSIDDQNAAIYTSILDLQDQVATWAMTDADTARNIDALAQARVRERIATEEALLARQLLNGASQEEIAVTQKALAGLREQLKYREQEADLNEQIRQQQEDRAAFDRTVSQWTDTVRAIDDVFRKGFADMVNEGEGSWKAFTKSMATTFKTTVADTLYKAFAQPFVVRIIAQMAGIMGGPGVGQQVMQQAGIGGGMPSMGWLTDFGGSITDTLNNFAWKNIGSEGFMGDISRSLFDSSEAIGQFAEIGGDILGYGKAIFAAIDGEWGKAAGTAIGQFAGGPIGAMIGSFIGGFIDEAFAGETRFGAGYMVDPATGRASRTGGPSGGDSSAAAAITAIEGVWSTTATLAERLGGSLAGLSFGAGSEISPEKGNSFVWSSWGRTPEEVSYLSGMRDLSGVTDGQAVAQEFAVELQRAVLRGLQMADLSTTWAEYLGQIDVSALDEAGINNVLATIDALVQLRGVAAAMGMQSLADASVMAQANIIALSGGIDAFSANLQTYQQAFYSDSERQAAAVDTISRALAGLGLTMPPLVGTADEMRAAWRYLVDAQDLTTEAGQRTYAALIGLAGAFDGVANAAQAAALAQQQAAAAAAAAIQSEYDAIAQAEYEAARTAWERANTAYQDAVSGAQTALQIVRNAIDRQKADLQAAYESQAGVIQSTIDAAQGAVTRLEAMAGRLSSTLDSMFASLDPLGTQQQAMLDIAAAAMTARLTGVLPDMASLETALQRVATPSTDRYASLVEFQRDFYGTAADIGYLQELAGDQLTLEQRALTAAQDSLAALTSQYESQVAYYDSALDLAQAQYDAMLGNTVAVMSVEDAIANLGSALARLGNTPNPGSAPTPPAGSVATPESIVAGWYRDILGFEDPAGVAYWAEQLRAQGRGDAFDDFVWVGKQQGTIPSFDVGTNFVPHDMTANIHRGERIIPAAENRELMARLSRPAGETTAMQAAMDSMAREMAEMRQENKQLLMQVVRYTRQTAAYTEAIDEWRQTGGVPVVEQPA